jgi:iron complex outermembrane receptor protein
MKGLTLTAGVRNLFDKEPPLSYQSGHFQAGYDPRYTDPTGRTAYVRATYDF